MTDRTSLTKDDLKNPRGERRCMVGVGSQGENTFEPFVRAAWADAEITQLRGNLSLAEDGLAAAMQEIERRDQQLKQSVDHEVEYKREIEQLRDALRRARRIAAEGTTHIGMIAALGILVDRALNHSGPLPPFDSPSNEPNSPQAPIAKITVTESGAGHYAPDDVSVSLYAPGLPPGEHDLYCEPEVVAPYLKPDDELTRLRKVATIVTKARQEGWYEEDHGWAEVEQLLGIKHWSAMKSNPAPAWDCACNKPDCAYCGPRLAQRTNEQAK